MLTWEQAKKVSSKVASSKVLSSRCSEQRRVLLRTAETSVAS